MALFKKAEQLPSPGLLVEADAAALAPSNVFVPEYDVALRFSIKRIAKGEFKNLWELCAINEDGSVDELIVDADSLTSCIGHMGMVFENRGY